VNAQAFDFEPVVIQHAGVCRASPLCDYALEPGLAHSVEESFAHSDDVVAVTNGFAASPQEAREHILAHIKRLRAQVGVSEEQQVESIIMRPGSATGQLCEIRTTILIEHD
jgi:hypothetical protein